jgi:hypothetical protein
VRNVLDALPASVQRTAKKMLADIRDAADRDHAVTAVNAFAHEFGAKWPKAVAVSRSSEGAGEAGVGTAA